MFSSFSDSESTNSQEIKKLLSNNNIEFSFNQNPERYISKSLSQTKLKKYLECPKCFFEKGKETEEKNVDTNISNSIHLIADILLRDKESFPTSTEVLDFINFSDGYLLEKLKTDDQNLNYDILTFLTDIENPEIRNKIISGSLIVYGTAKRLGFEQIRKRDSISINLKHKSNQASTILYTNPDFTGRHLTTNNKTLRRYDNFLIDYKLNFDSQNINNTIQTAFYFLTHSLSNRNIHHYYVLDITKGNLYDLEKINLIPFLKIVNNFLVLKNLNYRGLNPDHYHKNKEATNSQINFFDDLNVNNFGNSFGSKTYNNTLLLLKELKESITFNNLGQVVKQNELEKIYSKYPIKFD